MTWTNDEVVPEPIILICSCPTCLSGDERCIKLHCIEIYDHFPEMPWKTSTMQKKEDIRGIMKSYNCDYQRALKIYNGETRLQSQDSVM